MSQPLVSIIMPAYNSEKYVAEAIESVIHQTYNNWELLAVDDGSTDTTGAIIDAYAAKNARIRVFHTKNKGVSHARNIGLDEATGEWVTFLDSDDLLPKDALRHYLENIERCDMVIGNWSVFPDERVQCSRVNENRLYTNFNEFACELGFVRAESRYGRIRKLVRRDILRECYFCEKYQYYEDLHFFARLANQLGPIRLITDEVYRYRWSENENTNSLIRQFASADLGGIRESVEIFINIFEAPNIRAEIYTWYLTFVICKINLFVNDLTLDVTEKKKSILSLLNCMPNCRVPIMDLRLSPTNLRKAALLQIGDIDMIMTEFAK